jgi:hypothetical protein
VITNKSLEQHRATRAKREMVVAQETKKETKKIKAITQFALAMIL